MEIPIEISEKEYHVYYRYRKSTKEQKRFVKDLLKYLLSFFTKDKNYQIDITDQNLIKSQIAKK